MSILEKQNEESSPQSSPSKPYWVDDYVAGVISGCAGVFVGSPFDVVRVRLQTQQQGTANSYRGTWHAFTSMVRQEGVLSLFKGMSSPMFSVGFLNAVNFGIYGGLKRHWQGSDAFPSMLDVFNAGFLSGCVSTLVLAPSELLKIQLQLQREHFSAPKLRMRDIAKQIYKERGITGIYHGFWVTWVRDAPSWGVYFMTYEWLRRFFAEINQKNGLFLEQDLNSSNAVVTAGQCLFAGAAAGMLSWVGCYPLDVVKARVQSDFRKSVYRNSWDCAAKSWKEGVANAPRGAGPLVKSAFGCAVFLRGMWPTMLQAAPMNAATFYVYEECMNLLSASKDSDVKK